MSANTEEFVGFVLDQLAPLGDLTRHRVFGDAALKCKGRQFAMMMDNALYHGSACFSYENGIRRVEVRRYQEVPTQVLENTDFLVAWGREVVVSAAKGKRNSRRRKPGA